MNCDTCEPFAILGGINSESKSSESSIPSEKDLV